MDTQGLIWTPGPQEVLILSQEQETHLTATITVAPSIEGLAASALAWSWPDAEPLHKEITWSRQGSLLALQVRIQDWVGVFPKQIHFMRDGAGAGIGQAPGVVSQFEDVPAAQADVYSYRPDPINMKRFRLAIDALNIQGKVIETAEYTITVYANYLAGRNQLKSTVQTRKDAIT